MGKIFEQSFTKEDMQQPILSETYLILLVTREMQIKKQIEKHYIPIQFGSVQSLSCVRLFVTPWTAAGLPVHHQLLEFTQTHAIQPSHPLLSPFPPAFNLSQHEGLFK